MRKYRRTRGVAKETSRQLIGTSTISRRYTRNKGEVKNATVIAEALYGEHARTRVHNSSLVVYFNKLEYSECRNWKRLKRRHAAAWKFTGLSS